MSIVYKSVSSEEELDQILVLQKNNLSEFISQTEKEKEGFVTVKHDFDILDRMNTQQPHIIAKHKDVVVGYTLCMTKNFGSDIEILKPMFTKIDELLDQNIPYLVMGQVCIEKAYRGKGIFNGLYQKMKLELQKTYNLLITEVASDNLRSLKAHKNVGFKTLTTYSSDNILWHIISWNWE